MLRGADVELAFRRLVRLSLPDQQATILDGGRAGPTREAERVWAFSSAFERNYFPIYECDELEQLMCCIPFVRFGWSYDDFHDLDLRTGTLLLRGLCAEQYEATIGARVPLLEAVEQLQVPRGLLQRLPPGGMDPRQLHAALDGSEYAAAAEFADWTWGQTELAFLDCDAEVEVMDAEWSEENISELARQWRLAEALMERVHALEAWLEQDPANHFARLLNSALAVETNVNEVQARSADDREPTREIRSGSANDDVAIQASAAA
jgi:hypothetical protein